MPVLLNSAQNIFQSEFNYEIESKKICILFFFLFFFSHFFFLSLLFFSVFFFSFLSLVFFSLFFSPSFQNKLDKMQIGSSEDVNDLNYYYDNEWWVARGGN